MSILLSLTVLSCPILGILDILERPSLASIFQSYPVSNLAPSLGTSMSGYPLSQVPSFILVRRFFPFYVGTPRPSGIHQMHLDLIGGQGSVIV